MTNKVLFILTVSAVITSTVLCFDPFENFFNTRLDCYNTTQKGCNTSFVDAHPELKYSWSGMNIANTYFYCFTNTTPDEPELMHKCGGQLPPNSTYNCSCPTIFIFPGYISGICNYAIFREIKNEILKSGCFNVILVDWMWGNYIDLYAAKQNAHICAKQSAIVIDYLKKHCNQTAADFILIGHSVGAHLAGFVGQLTKIGTVHGVEAAGGMFSQKEPLNERLDAGDADCVQVMHCNAGQCIPIWFGVNFTCGTMDFFVNDGLYQPGCYIQAFKSIAKGDLVYAFFSLLFNGACNHFQCLQYYRASINPTDCQFVGAECETNAQFQSGQCNDCGPNGTNCAVMGAYACNCPSKSGNNTIYRLKARLDCPFCVNSQPKLNGYNCPVAKVPPPQIQG